jgi:hypothetical protein
MAPAAPSQRQQLLDAHHNVRRQIDRLEARYYPFAPIGFVRGGIFPMILFLLGLGCVAPFQTNGVWIDNGGLIQRLTQILHDIEEALEGLGPDD